MKAFTAGTLVGVGLGLFMSLAQDDHGETIKDKLTQEGQAVGTLLADLGRGFANAQEASGRLANALPQAGASLTALQADLQKDLAQFSQDHQD